MSDRTHSVRHVSSATYQSFFQLAIALAANIGGQSSPISSPQNLIALGEMEHSIGWDEWFIVALPVSFISIILIWILLVLSYKPHLYTNRSTSLTPRSTGDFEGESGTLQIRPIRPTKEKFTIKQYWVMFVCVLTIGLWCVEHGIEEYVGDMGVIALLPILAFFSTGVLKKDDFEKFAWTIVFLAMGGIALGKGVVSSGLLEILHEKINHLVRGYGLYEVVLILSPIILVCIPFCSCPEKRDLILLLIDRFDIYFTYHREYSPRTNCERSWKEHPGSTTKPTHFYYGADLFYRDGYARFRIS
jgi:phosphate transporter